MSYTNQHPHRIRFDWGLNGMHTLADTEAVVIVDLMSFTTCVDVVVAQNGAVYPFAFKDERAEGFARERGLQLASPKRSLTKLSLSASSLVSIGAESLVLPSPNGSLLTTHAGSKPCFAASLRNAPAVAAALSNYQSISVIGSGERWEDDSVRFALEDMIGAGAVIAHLSGSRSPEAMAAQSVFESCFPALTDRLMECASGRELRERGFEADVLIASEWNVSQAVPFLSGERYVNAQTNVLK